MKNFLPLAFISLLVLADCTQKEKTTASATPPIAGECNPALEQESEALKFSGEDRGDICQDTKKKHLLIFLKQVLFVFF